VSSPIIHAVPSHEIRIDKAVVEEIAKLQLTHGDILVLRVHAKTEPTLATTIVQSFRQWLRGYGFDDIRVLLIVGDTHVEALSEAQMAEYGWVRRKRKERHMTDREQNVEDVEEPARDPEPGENAPENVPVHAGGPVPEGSTGGNPEAAPAPEPDDPQQATGYSAPVSPPNREPQPEAPHKAHHHKKTS
jgi:hypothetical protein